MYGNTSRYEVQYLFVMHWFPKQFFKDKDAAIAYTKAHSTEMLDCGYESVRVLDIVTYTAVWTVDKKSNSYRFLEEI